MKKTDVSVAVLISVCSFSIISYGGETRANAAAASAIKQLTYSNESAKDIQVPTKAVVTMDSRPMPSPGHNNGIGGIGAGHNGPGNNNNNHGGFNPPGNNNNNHGGISQPGHTGPGNNNNNHGGFNPPSNGGPGHTGPGNNIPNQPQHVDTTQASREGREDGMRQGRMEGELKGRQDGAHEGSREGERKGRDEGYNAGKNEGNSAGLNTDQSEATAKGSRDGQYAGVDAGRKNGQNRCYNEGYAPAYNTSYTEAKKLGLADAVSYSQGYAAGKDAAAQIEQDNGTKAGYQNGFALREAEIVNSFPNALRGAVPATRSRFSEPRTTLPIALARGGYSTPEERRAYEEAFRRAHDDAFDEAYRHAKRKAYQDEYQHAYELAYNSNYQSGYSAGYSDGKDTAYQIAYKSAYNTQYNNYYAEYSNMEYADSRALGQQTGAKDGNAKGFKDGCQETYTAAYNKGYQETAAVVYPAAFQAGKLTGIAAAEKYYSENAVLKVGDIDLVDENGDGKFEAAEGITVKGSIRNLGFQQSSKVKVSVASAKNELLAESEISINPVGPRADMAFEVKLGTIYDTVASDADTLTVTFTGSGVQAIISRQAKAYVRSNTAVVGVITDNEVSVRKRADMLFGGSLGTLNRGDRVIMLEKGWLFYKVRKPMFSAGSWTEGYVRTSDMVLQ